MMARHDMISLYPENLISEIAVFPASEGLYKLRIIMGWTEGMRTPSPVVTDNYHISPSESTTCIRTPFVPIGRPTYEQAVR